MVFLVLAYLGGALTILSPCILPVLPFVFARAGGDFRRTSLPVLIGMALTFTLVASVAAIGGGAVVAANHYGRLAALALMALFGLALLWPGLAERMARPAVALGAQLSQPGTAGQSPRFVSSLLLGVATGLLWAPCAGPILGLILTGAALHGASLGTSLLLLAYAAGAATSLGTALLLGGKVFAALKRGLGAGEWLRRGLGIAVLASVLVIATGADTGALARLSLASTNGLEQALISALGPAHASPIRLAAATRPTANLPVEGSMPSLAGASAWLNGGKLTRADLRGHVVLVDFWTYSCINCLRALPYVEAWAKKYAASGLIVIGVHAPEFAFERNIDNVRAAIRRLGVTYPVAIDNDYAIWHGFDNEYWPAHYFIDAQGRIRHHHFGEGDYAQSERIIRALLREAGATNLPGGASAAVQGVGVEKAADFPEILSPETYIGSNRAQNFVSPGGEITSTPHAYTAPGQFALNDWALTGIWQVNPQSAQLVKSGGGLTFRFHARDLNLVLGTPPGSPPVPFQITLDGQLPGADHGVDSTEAGTGTITGQRLYQLIRLQHPDGDHTLTIQFLSPGVSAYAFTFG